MEPVKTRLDVHPDERGAFVELARLGDRSAASAGPPSAFRWAQWNCSTSAPNVFRGFHYQAEPHAQAKLVTLLSGSITDYCLDLLSGEMRSFDLEPFDQLYIPTHFAHAFYTHEPSIVVYACSLPRVEHAERALRVPGLHEGAIRSPRDATAAFWREEQR